MSWIRWLAVWAVAACHAPGQPSTAAPMPSTAIFVADGSITPALAMVVKGKVLVDPVVAVTSSRHAVLIGGRVEVADPDCTTDPPDYEKANQRYFACRHPTDPQQWEAVADSPIAMPHATTWKQRNVVVYGPRGVLCDGTTGGDSQLIGSWRAGVEQVVVGVDASDPAAVAGAVLKHNAALVTSLTADCAANGLVVRDKQLPPLALWTVSAAAPAIAALATTALASRGATSPGVPEAPDPSSATVVVAHPASGHGHVLVIASIALTSCNGDPTVGGIWELEAGTELRELALVSTEHDDGQFAPRLVADSDGDGWPEIVTARGIHVGHGDGFAYTPWLQFDDVFNGPWCGD